MNTARAIAYPEDADYTISEEEHDRLGRVQQAASLLATLNHDIATRAGISHYGILLLKISCAKSCSTSPATPSTCVNPPSRQPAPI
ncbi:hypothetical protein [Xanthomonas vasicola]|uniref:hypothetical protein n=1 Tax=Xanthomonas vasicola TaxID=56459 RepID=UPI00034B04BB|nr:hypothetical protein [Xanthomonas vasicola]MDO6945996.1 hypothetical protein [Xanthomonas vasicola]MDO6958062.1 hypothetical protein [Xanthomonas vasicola]